jgi:hypothetical protein
MAHWGISLCIYIVEVMVVRLFGATLVEMKFPLVHRAVVR